MIELDPKNVETFFFELADLAAKETLPRFRQSIDVSNKDAAGFDPVTEADKQAESVIRRKIESTFPDHGIFGEEYGTKNPTAEYQWIIDPVDGTRAFISGIPVWGTLVGLYKNGNPLAGMMAQPFTDEIFFCDGAASYYRRGQDRFRIQTSSRSELSQATLMTTSPDLFGAEEKLKYKSVEKSCKLVRYGADCYAYCLLASGHIDLVIESGLNLYDIAALVPIIEKAGGQMTDWQGNPNPKGGNIIAAADTKLHAEALALLNS